ncbi:Glyco hydro 2 C domain containing protein, partial [Asbolus verrucosus]
MKTIRDITILLLILSATLCNCLMKQNLGGQWKVTGADGDMSYFETGAFTSTVILTEITIDNATVPGGIFSDLMNNGKIGDIFYGTGDTDYRWVGLSDWTYSTTFTVEPVLLSYLSVNLVFEGLDTFATVSINGQEVGQSKNMFVRYVFNVGTNEIVVQFSSPVNVAAALANQTVNEYVIPPECPHKEYNGICHANRIRKMQSSFAWDWGPAFASKRQLFRKDVYLEAFDTAVIDYVIATASRNPDRDIWDLEIATYFNGGILDQVWGTINATLETEIGTIRVSHDFFQYINMHLELLAVTKMEVPIDVVKSWWPNGYGSQNLYNLKLTFANEDDTDERALRVGFRTVELVQEELEQGRSFYFKVNGHPIFAKGANEIPINVLPERGQDREVVRKVLQSAKDVHMNMLRVWGGGVYESDYFYDLADEFGILIWQDFMFACAMYPADSDYLSNVVDEVRHQVKRLGGHPSIAIWSANNENEAALSQNWYNITDNNFTLYKNDYIKLYVNTIQPEVLRILPGAIYITSSPTNGLESDQEDHIAKNPADPLYGD